MPATQTVPRATSNFVRRTQRVNAVATAAAARQWRKMRVTGYWARQWEALSPDVENIVTAAQLSAARAGAAYVTEAMAEQGSEAPVTGLLVAEALAGIAPDGRSLAGLLEAPVIHAGKAFTETGDAGAALVTGGNWLSGLVSTILSDTARAGTTVRMAQTRTVTGWVRALQAPSCGRCIVLAGRVYKYSDGFRRHPLCDCRHIPVTSREADKYMIDPTDYFHSLSREEQDEAFGEAEAEAIRLGADISRVVNARRMTTASTIKGKRTKGQRLMPEAILETAANREDAIRLLTIYGFIRP